MTDGCIFTRRMTFARFTVSPSGAPLACLRQSRGLHRLKPDPQHPPPHTPASQAIAHAHVRAHAQIDVPKQGIYLVHLYCGWIYAWESDCRTIRYFHFRSEEHT